MKLWRRRKYVTHKQQRRSTHMLEHDITVNFR